ncbi:MAG: 3-oxoacyl-[acyl-carrier-protein] reductase [Planctomycetota bacterium]|nr:3-oxoacyl-[acyl-carrier-protein] reductase [Planctomycetota bacterium]
MIITQRVAIVTGASRGIGKAIARRLASDGHLVVLVARTIQSLQDVHELIEADGGSSEVKLCDVGDSESFSSLIEEIASTHGRLDILVNNAGITRDGLILRMSDDDFDTVYRVNLFSAFVSCRAASKPMMRGRFGRMINIGSVTGQVGNAGQSNYAAAKAGLVGMTKSIAKELGPKGVTANVIAPGYIETDMTEAFGDDLKTNIAKTVPARRFGTPEEIAAVVSFVASDEASYLSGQVIVVDGGLTC